MRFKEFSVHAENFRAAASATEQGGKIAASEWHDVGVVDGPHAGARGYGRPIDANADAAECGHVGDFWLVPPVGSIAAPTLMCRRTDLRVIPDRRRCLQTVQARLVRSGSGRGPRWLTACVAATLC